MNDMLILAGLTLVITVSIIAAIVWFVRAEYAKREGFDNWDSLNIPGNELKFADRGGGCSAGFTKVTDGSNKGMCAPDRYTQGRSAPAPVPAPPKAKPQTPPKSSYKTPASAPKRQQNWLEKLSELQDPLSAGKGGANAKPVVYNQGAYRKRPNITIASSGSKFRPADGGKCPAGYSKIMSGARKGMCVKSEYARGGTQSGQSRTSGSKFSSKVNGKCPNGFSEITAGGRKGMCIKWEYAGKPSGSRSSSPSRKSSGGGSGSKFISKVDGRCPSGTSEITYGGHKGECYRGGSGGSSGSSSKWSSGATKGSSGAPGGGSKFVAKAGGKCPSGTTAVGGRGKWADFCIKNSARESIEQNRGNIGSIYKQRESASCPKGMTLIKSGSRKGQCIDEGKVINREYKFWGWGPNAGLRCKNSNNTGCETKWVGGKLVDTKKKPILKKHTYWGWGKNAGLLCSNPNNTGCNTQWSGGKLVEKATSKPASKPAFYWGWGPHAGMKCKNPDNTGCDTTFGYSKPKIYKNSSTPLSQKSEFKYPGKGKTEGLMCKNPDGTVCDASSRYNRK